MNSMSSGAPAERSTFVTVLAWIFILMSGFSTVMAVFQYVVMSFVMPLARMQASLDELKARGDMPMPPGAEFMFGHMRLIFGAFLLLSAITLLTSIGLLKRRNWARLVFICLMALGIVWNIAGLFLQQLMLSGFPRCRPTRRRNFARSSSR